MTHYKARELQDKDGKPLGLYHYTAENDGSIWPVGYCSSLKSCPECAKDPAKMIDLSHQDDCDLCHGKRLVRVETPCPGHATEQEACEHYRQYLLDKAVYAGPKKEAWPKEKCARSDCNQEATHLAYIPGQIGSDRVFCAAHCNRQSLESFVFVGESWSS